MEEEEAAPQSPPAPSPLKSTGSSTAGGDDDLPILTTNRFQTPSDCYHVRVVPVIYRLRPRLSLNPSLHPTSARSIGSVSSSRWTGSGTGCSGDPRSLPIPLRPWTTTRRGAGRRDVPAAKTGLKGRDERGAGFTLAMAGWSLLGKEDAASAAFDELRGMVSQASSGHLPNQVARLDPPVLRAGDDCGELQQAVVSGLLTDGRQIDCLRKPAFGCRASRRTCRIRVGSGTVPRTSPGRPRCQTLSS